MSVEPRGFADRRRSRRSDSGLPAPVITKRLRASAAPRVCATAASPNASATERRRQLRRPAAACRVRPSASRRATCVRRAATTANRAAVWHAAVSARSGWLWTDCSGAIQAGLHAVISALHCSWCPRARAAVQGRAVIICVTDANTDKMLMTARAHLVLMEGQHVDHRGHHPTAERNLLRNELAACADASQCVHRAWQDSSSSSRWAPVAPQRRGSHRSSPRTPASTRGRWRPAPATRRRRRSPAAATRHSCGRPSTPSPARWRSKPGMRLLAHGRCSCCSMHSDLYHACAAAVERYGSPCAQHRMC